MLPSRYSSTFFLAFLSCQALDVATTFIGLRGYGLTEASPAVAAMLAISPALWIISLIALDGVLVLVALAWGHALRDPRAFGALFILASVAPLGAAVGNLFLLGHLF